MVKKLEKYRKKRDFTKTKEPEGGKTSQSKKPIFVIQKHYARSLHYDFRLEIDGTLKSWAVPKGLSKSSKDKRLAVLTEDHPLEYASFKGTIPEGEYGAGKVEIFDKGTYENIKYSKSNKLMTMKGAFRQGRIEIILHGKKFKGSYALVKFKDKNWLIIKMKS